MSDPSDLIYELLQRLHAEFADFRRDMVSVKMRLGPLAQQRAVIVSDIARINVELDYIRNDVALIKRRLDLTEV